MAVLTYDPDQISVIVGGQIMSGFGDGTFVSVDRNSDAFTLQMGATGAGTRSKSNNRSGRITVSLQQTSESNDALQAFATADELSNSGTFPVLVKDNQGRSLYAAEIAWVVKVPTGAYATENSNREWILETDNLEVFTGGN